MLDRGVSAFDFALYRSQAYILRFGMRCGSYRLTLRMGLVREFKRMGFHYISERLVSIHICVISINLNKHSKNLLVM